MKTTLRTYQRLEQLAQQFAQRQMNLLIIAGRAGTSKTTTIRRAVGDTCLYLEGTLSAFQLYRLLYLNQDLPIILDDVDGIYKDKDTVRILKLLCQTEDVKTIQWNTASKQLAAEDIPTSFITTSPVCLITNSWKMLNENVEAVVDRGLLARFEPTPFEVHQYAKGIVADTEVYEFIGSLLPLISEPSLRHYRHASDYKRNGFEWQDILLETLDIDPNMAILVSILKDGHITTMQEKIKRFSEQTGLSRATYYRFKSEFEDAQKTGFIVPMIRDLVPTLVTETDGASL